MTTTAILGLPFIATQQSQPEVTHNAALVMIQALLQGAVARQNAPAGGPADGALYIVGDTPTGAWAAHANKLAVWYGGAWLYVPGFNSLGAPIAMGAAQEGLRVWVQDINEVLVWSGAAWVSAAIDRSFTVAQLAAETPTAGRRAFCTDETGGAVPVFGDGAAWRRVTDRAVAS